MSGDAAGEPVSLDNTGKAFSLRLADHLNDIILIEHIDQYLVADAGSLIARLDAHFPQDSRGRHAGALEVSLRRLVYPSGRLLFNQPQLHCVVAVGVDGLLLNYNAWTGLDNRHRCN